MTGHQPPIDDNEDPRGARRRIRKDHLFVKRMREIRMRHGIAIVDVEACMQEAGVQIPHQTLRQIEEGRRPLPHLITTTGAVFGEWFTTWLRCVGCVESERAELEDILMHIVLGR